MSLVQQVVDQLFKYAVFGHLEPCQSFRLQSGDVLRESEVMKQLAGDGIEISSRSTFRSAVSKLVASGILESRQNWGTRVIDPTPQMILENLNLRIVSEMHFALRLARMCRNAEVYPDHFFKIQKIQSEMDSLCDSDCRNDLARFVSLDCEFHKELARLATHGIEVDSLERKFFSVLQMAVASALKGDARKKACREHHFILSAIKGESGAAAADAVWLHLTGSAERWIADDGKSLDLNFDEIEEAFGDFANLTFDLNALEKKAEKQIGLAFLTKP